MKALNFGGLVLAGVLCFICPSPMHAVDAVKVRLFILSGQSNMVRFDPDVTFTPALKKAYPGDELIVVKSAEGGQPIARWYKGWKSPDGKPLKKGEVGDLYDVLMTKVRDATKGKTVDTVTFVWMQGEADAKRGGEKVYEESLRGLIKQLRDDLKRPDLTVVIGRLSEFKNGDAGWDAVRAAQVKVAEADPSAGWVDTDRINDGKVALHYSQKGYAEMGRRFSAKSVELLAKVRKP